MGGEGPRPLVITMGAALGKPLRLGMGALIVWIYGLAVGQGFVAKLLSADWLVKCASPAAYSIFLFHWPITQYYRFFMHGGFGEPRTLHPAELLLLAVISTLLAIAVQHYLSAPLTALFMRCFDCLCPCCKPTKQREADTLSSVIEAIGGLTGVEADASTRIEDCGLNSFGTGVLIGSLKNRFPNLHLSPVRVYHVATVGELAAEVDAALPEGSRSHV